MNDEIYVSAAEELSQFFCQEPLLQTDTLESCVWLSPFFSAVSESSKETAVETVKGHIETLLTEPSYAGGKVRSIRWLRDPHETLNPSGELGRFRVIFVRNSVSK